VKRKIPDLPKTFGAIFSVVTIVGVVVLNSWAALDGVVNNTISAWVTWAATRTAATPLGTAAVMGHWASRGQDFPPMPGGPIPLIVLLVCMLIFDLTTDGFLARYPYWVWCPVGFGIGAILWPMASVAA